MSTERRSASRRGKRSSRRGNGSQASGRGDGRKATARRGGDEVSAGGVVVDGSNVIVIVPTRRAADGSSVLGLPKGHIDPGESPLAAALREVREEAGVIAQHVADLPHVHYWYTRSGKPISKVVHFFLLRYLSGDLRDHDDEVEEAKWMPLAEAVEELTYDGEREAVSHAIELIGAGLHGT